MTTAPVGGPAWREHVPLAPLTTLRLGGPARYFVECRTAAEVRHALGTAAARGLPAYILGGGSNVVFPDSGFPGVVVRIAIDHVELRDGGAPGVIAGAGAEWDAVVRAAVERGWSGIECLSGIPGSVGGTPIQNVGAYGQALSDSLVSVSCLDRERLEPLELEAAACDFGYRTSRFKARDRGRFVVLGLSLRLRRDTRPELRYPELTAAMDRRGRLDALPPADAVRAVRETVLALRRGKSMVLDPADPNTQSAGSFFLNPVVTPDAFGDVRARWEAAGGADPIPSYPVNGLVKLPAAWLVEHAGFPKGFQAGGVGISDRHALALVNRGGTAAELVALAHRIMAAVEERFGVRLVPEPEIVTV